MSGTAEQQVTNRKVLDFLSTNKLKRTGEWLLTLAPASVPLQRITKKVTAIKDHRQQLVKSVSRPGVKVKLEQ